MRWFDRQSTAEEETDVAWAYLINSPDISVYTFEDGKEVRQLVNSYIAPQPEWYNQPEENNLK